jgi:type I restriction enzyme, R subunit
MSIHTETDFESAIESHLLQHGYLKLNSKAFDIDRVIFPATAIEFIQQTQPQEWARLEQLHGDNTADRILSDLCKWLDTYGSLQILRHGFKCYGRTLRIAYFKAAHNLNPELERQYQANQVSITRQLRYGKPDKKSTYSVNSPAPKSGIIDLTLSLNGIPLITLELKNPLTGQTAEDAKHQYRQDRDPRAPIFEFKRRTLVHFAVDTEVVWMTTRLAGSATYFLPFNQGNAGTPGNPPDPQGRNYRTAYLWEEVLQLDSLLDLFARFLHLQEDEKRDDEGRKFTKETLIFPRYHQLQAVRSLVQSAQSEGVGHNYLIEHSAGSGKSNTIGWLTHRLSSLHNDRNERIFDSVIVITDRRVLDRQLQSTIYQFEHRQGVVQKIDKDAKQLTAALETAVPIIITTLQKFPHVTKQLLKLAEERQQGSALLPTRRCAVIIDEAHSSQSGESAIELKGVLGGEQLQAAAQQQAEAEGLPEIAELFRSMSMRSHQANLSFFAFTATPKHKTLKFFGRDGRSFHQYTMQQAIEEGFIMDVLSSYTTYATYYKLTHNATTDPHVERKAAASALARFIRLHPHNIAQKTEVIVEHFNTVSRHKIGGKAKAMVVTSSRLEAIRYKESFDKYIRDRKYSIKSLVAFSGIVTDDKIPTKTYTEELMNGVREKELPDRFATNEYQVLLVAEKYQTGFDQPLLHSMYIDRRLSGIQAVQTLSRLNRIHPLKEDTFILDFINDREEIRTAFKQFYEGAEMGEEATPDRLYELMTELDRMGIYLPEEIDRFCRVYFKPKQRQSAADRQTINAILDPVVDRFRDFQTDNSDDATLWRDRLTAFRKLYAFLSQVIPYQDSDLEKHYVFLRHLGAKLPHRDRSTQYDFDGEVRLEYYRLQKISEGSIDLNQGYGQPLDGPKNVGSSKVSESSVSLSQLVTVINDRFGTDFNRADGLFFEQLISIALTSTELQQAATANSPENFQLLFKQILESLFIDRVEQNEEIFARYMNDNSFQKLIAELLSKEVYQQLLALKY